MIKFSKRFEIRLDQTTFDLLQEKAQRENTSMGHLIRAAIDQTFKHKDRKKKNLASKQLCQMSAPVSDWSEMEKEIEQGYL